MLGFDLGGDIIMKKNLVAVLAAVVMTASMVACGSAAADRTGLGAAAHHELCRKAGYPLWHRAVLAGTAGSPYRPCSAGHVAGRGAAWP